MNIPSILSVLEDSSLLILLFQAVRLKRGLDMPEAVSIIGPIHGVLLIVFSTHYCRG